MTIELGQEVVTTERLGGMNFEGEIEYAPVGTYAVIASVEDNGTFILFSETENLEIPDVDPRQFKVTS